MENNFDIKKYLVENKMTRNSRLLNENENNSLETWKQELINLIKSNTDLEDNEISIDNSQIEKYFHDGKTPEEVYFDEWQEDYGNFRAIDEQESSLEDELMAQLDEKVGPWSLKKGDQHPENFEPSYDDEDYEEYDGHEESETSEEYKEHQPGGEEELDEMDFDSLEEEINAMLEADKDLYNMDEFDESLDEMEDNDEEELYEAKKPSAGLTKKEKSAVVKKARAGKDIGKKGKGFEKVAAAAGGGEKGKKIAASKMWSSIKRK